MATIGFQFKQLAVAYRDIALRHLQAANLLLPHGLYDIVVFHCYHTTESIASSALALSGENPTLIRVHRTKLEKFRAHLQQTGAPFLKQALDLTFEMETLRETSLYPQGTPLDPLKKFDPVKTTDMLQNVQNFVQTMRGHLRI